MVGETAGLQMGAPTRDAFGKALAEIASEYPDTVVLDADVNNSTRTEWFKQKYPERFFNLGIAESNLVSVAGGLASCGKTPVIASFACFIMCNAYDQLRMSIAYPGLNVKVVGSHSGISIGEDGVSQMGIEDVALACSLPGFTVMVPCDEHQTRAAVRAMIRHAGPCYLRVGRGKQPIIYRPDDFPASGLTIGKAVVVRPGNDVTLVANGLMVAAALDAAELLSRESVSARVIDMPTVKPIDMETLTAAAVETRGIVVCEEHLAHGGLGAAVARTVAQTAPCPMAFVDLKDAFAESGSPDELLKKYGLTGESIADAGRLILSSK